MSERSTSSGFTLIELIVTVAVLVIISMTVVPLVQDMLQKQRIAAAAEAIHAQVMLAKSESYKRSTPIYVAIDEGGAWALGVSDASGCNPSGTDCTLTYVESDGTTTTVQRTISSTEYPGASMDGDSPDEISFNPIRGTADSRTIELESEDYEVRIIVNSTGRVRICSPAGSDHLGRYPDC
jgi:prepilin-type N-terminal cleavage/methylation domain-containing protein